MSRSSIAIVCALLLSSCGGGYDFKKYEKYREDGELSDVVHEWISAYVEQHCYTDGQEIICR